MKKFANIALTMVLVLAACSKLETSPVETTTSRISFEVGCYAPQTKAGEVSFLDNYAGSFRSKAWMRASGIAPRAYFGEDGETIKWDGASKNWVPGHDYYWPKSSSSYIDFFSWYDNFSCDPAIVYDNAASPTTATMTWTRTVEASDVILVAEAAWRQSANTSTYSVDDPSVAGVPTLFRNYLSRVEMKMRSLHDEDPDNSTVTYEVTLQSAKISGLYHTGTLTLTNADPGAKGSQAWTATSGTDYAWVADTGSASDVDIAGASISKTPVSILAQRSFLPQQLTNAKLDLLLTITTKSNGTVTASESDIAVSLNLNTIKNASNVAITTWVPNKTYTYTLIINPINQEILLEPTLQNWSSDVEFISVVVE